MQVILREDLPKLGRAGEVVNVKNGYGRNYLIPQGLAALATPRNVKQLVHQKRIVETRLDKVRKSALSVAERLEGLSVTVARQAGDRDRLFGSVSAKDIANALQSEGIDVQRRNVDLERPLKQLGIHPVSIRLHAEVQSEIRVWVVAKA